MTRATTGVTNNRLTIRLYDTRDLIVNAVENGDAENYSEAVRDAVRQVHGSGGETA